VTESSSSVANRKYLMRVGESLVGIPQNEIRRMQSERPPLPKVLLVSLAFLLAIGFVASRLIRRGTPPVNGVRQSLVLGDIENPTGEDYLGEMVKQAVATKLTESPFLTVLPEKRVRDALEEMRHPSVRVRAQSVYEAALKGLKKLERVGWESDGSQIGWVTVEIWEQPTQHRVHVGKMLGWIKSNGRTPRDETRKGKLRELLRNEK